MKHLTNTHLFPVILFITGLIGSGCTSQPVPAPVLILTGNSDFGSYTAEILKAEGFNEFEMDSLPGGLRHLSGKHTHDIVILAETQIDEKTATVLHRWVEKGGNLIAFRPDTSIADIFGIGPAQGRLSEGFLSIDTLCNEGRDIHSAPMRLHGTADLYRLTTGSVIALFSADRKGLPVAPGVVKNTFGKGHAIAFLYNLPKCIVYTRQGNPAFAGLEKDGIPGLRGMDLFADQWVDTADNPVNHADVQMALLSRCMEDLSQNAKPLPRLWYFPGQLKCLVTLTNDGEYSDEADFEPQFRDVDSLGADMTLYVLDINKVSKEWVEKWTSRGFEIAGHPDDTREAGDPRWLAMDSAIEKRKAEMTEKFGLPMHTNVNHWFVWCGRDAAGNPDFGAQALLEEKHGIGLDANYAHYDRQSSQGKDYLGQPGYNQGNFTGSGLVMKYATVSGKVSNVYQHFNAVYDQQYMELHDPEGFYQCFRGLADRSLYRDVFSVIGIKSHNDEYYFSKPPLMQMLRFAKEQHIPVWTEERLLGFLRAREESRFEDVDWKRNTLTFRLKSNPGHADSLSILIPATFNHLMINSLKVNGVNQPGKVIGVKGRSYAIVTLAPGTHPVEVVYLPESLPD